MNLVPYKNLTSVPNLQRCRVNAVSYIGRWDYISQTYKRFGFLGMFWYKTLPKPLFRALNIAIRLDRAKRAGHENRLPLRGRMWPQEAKMLILLRFSKGMEGNRKDSTARWMKVPCHSLFLNCVFEVFVWQIQGMISSSW